MNFKNILLILLISVSGFKAIQAQNLCYCAVKCGPRDIKEGDSPRPFSLPNGKQVCLCADRDEDILNQNPNKCKIRKSDINKTSAACGENVGYY